MESASEIPSFIRGWIERAYPMFPHAYWGRSGFTLMFDLLCQEDRRIVILPAFTCPNLSLMVIAAGKQVVHIEVDRNTLLVDPSLLERYLAGIADSDAILLMDHTFGYAFPGLREVRDRHPDLLIIEDCVRALGSEVDGALVGRVGDSTLLSLHKTIPGNDHGAILLTRSAYDVRSGPAPKLSVRTLASTCVPLRLAYERVKRRYPDFPDTLRCYEPWGWSPQYGVPHRLCARRFAHELRHLGAFTQRRLRAIEAMENALQDLDALTFIKPAPTCRSNGYFLSFTVEPGVSRNALLTTLHRQGFSLLRTWHLIPAFLDGFAHTFPFGHAESLFLSDHVAHIPMSRFLTARSQRRLIHGLRELERVQIG